MLTSTKDSLNASHDEAVKHYSTVARLIHYTSKFLNENDGKSSRNPSASRNFRLAPLWPEWNDAEINAESWDVGATRRREPMAPKGRPEPKISSQSSSHLFDDPEGKIELPSCFKVDQWKRPSDFIQSEKPIVVVDGEFGVQSFDLISSNSHLHQNEIFRQIISQINALWEICRRDRKTIERTWRPWEHIYALNKVTKSPFFPSYNSAGKYVVRLYFLGTWRKIIVDDTIPFDDKNRCLLPRTTLNHELWPLILSKALLKIIFLEINASSPQPTETSETIVLHSLTGWIPEPIPLKYGHAEKIWNFLRYDRSNKFPSENPNSSSFGPIPLFQWTETKGDKSDEIHSNVERDSQNLSDDKSLKKIGSATNFNALKVTASFKSQLSREKKTNVNPSLVVNPSSTAVSTIVKSKDVKKLTNLGRTNSIDESPNLNDDQNFPEAPKMIVFGTISTLQPDRSSSFTEKADRSERLRQYNINEMFSTSMLLTKLRDIPLEPPPPPPEPVPAWKLIRPRKPLVLPSAEPITQEKPKNDRWIEITSPYINYPTPSALNLLPTTRPASIESQITIVNTPIPGVHRPLTRSRTPSSQIKSASIVEVDEDEELKLRKQKSRLNSEAPRSSASFELNTPRRELSDVQNKFDEFFSANPSVKLRREMSIDKSKIGNQRASILLSRLPSDIGSIKSKIGENSHQNFPVKSIFTTPKIWMNFDDFCSCFTSIIIFHNPHGFQHSHKFTDVKFVPYQQPVVVPSIKEKKKENNQTVVQTIPHLHEDRSILYLFVETTRETADKNIELIVSLSSLSRWIDSTINENVLSTLHEKSSRGSSVTTEKPPVDLNFSKVFVSQKDVLPQSGMLICEVCSWKSLSLGQPILRLQTTSTKAAPITLKPGRHVLKLTNTCPLAFHLHVLSDTHDFLLGDEEQLLNKIVSVPEDRDFIERAEELFNALDESVENFHRIPPEENALTKLFRSFCEKSTELTLEKCENAFNQSLYPTIRTMMIGSGTSVNIDIQYAWRCFTNDRLTTDILHCYRTRRLSIGVGRHSARAATLPIGSTSPTKRNAVNRERSLDERSSSRHQTVSVLSPSISEVPNESSDKWTAEKIDELKNIQRNARAFLQRRVLHARTIGTEKNLIVQRSLINTMSILKSDASKSSLLLFRSLISNLSPLIETFQFSHDDWNMVSFHDYHGIYLEPLANNWFVIFRDVFYVHDETFLSAKFFSHLPNSILRIINNDNYVEMPLVFNRVAPGILRKNKFGYTFVAQGVSTESTPSQNRFRLRLLTAYFDLPEPRNDPLISSFYTREFVDYFLPNKDEILCRFRVQSRTDLQLTGRSFHLTTIQFVTSNPDAFFRLTIFDRNDEILNVEGKGSVVLPAVLFFSDTTTSTIPTVLSRPSSKQGSAGGRKREGSAARRGSGTESQEKSSTRSSSSGKKSRSTSRTENVVFDDEEKIHKYIIQVKLLRQSWPLTPSQLEFTEQIKEQEKNEFKGFNLQNSTPKTDESSGESRSTKVYAGRSSPTVKSRGNLSATGSGRVGTPSSRPSTGKSSIDTTKPHWILRIVSDSDKVDELIVKKDNERQEELMNMKKAWETVEAGRAQKAFENRQKYLESMKTNVVLPPLEFQSFLKQKFVDGETKICDSIFEQEEFERRQIEFMNFAEFNDRLKEKRREDFQNRFDEKVRQLTECVEFQGKINEIRRSMFEPREAFRQRFIEIERKRRAELAAEEQRLIDEGKAKADAMKNIGNKRNPSGKKKKK